MLYWLYNIKIDQVQIVCLYYPRPDELLALGAKRRKDSNRLPVRGKKRLEATGCQREKQLIHKKQDQSQAILAEERLIKL